MITRLLFVATKFQCNFYGCLLVRGLSDPLLLWLPRFIRYIGLFIWYNTYERNENKLRGI